MQDTKTSGHDKEKGFALLRTDSIQLWVWLQGYQPLDEQPLKSVSEDISYRIREASDCAVNFMRHCKRTKLKTSDLNQAFQQCNIEKNFGNINNNPLKYNIINTSDVNEKILKCFKTKLFELEDDVIDLKLPEDSREAKTSAKPTEKTIHGKWILVNGNSTHIESKELIETYSEEINVPKTEFDIESELFYMTILDDTYKNYYDMITGIILLQHNSPIGNDHELLFNRILDSLKTDLKLQPLLPYLINFLSRTVQSLTLLLNNKTSIISKTNLFFLQRCVQTLKHLIMNKNLFLAPKGFFSRILSCLLYCTLQNTTFTDNVEGLLLREKSAYTMVLFLKFYQRFSTNTLQYLTDQFFMQHFLESFDNDTHLFTSYGIIASLINFGGEIINSFYQTLLIFVRQLHDKGPPVKPFQDIHTHVLQITLQCFIVYFKWFLKKKSRRCFSWPKLLVVYKEIEEMYGDSFTNQVFEFDAAADQRFYKKCQVLKEDLVPVKNLVRELICYEEEKKIGNGDTEVFEGAKILNLFKVKKRIKINYGTPKLVPDPFISNNNNVISNLIENRPYDRNKEIVILINRIQLPKKNGRIADGFLNLPSMFL